jgi:hypothetical protein
VNGAEQPLRRHSNPRRHAPGVPIALLGRRDRSREFRPVRTMLAEQVARLVIRCTSLACRFNLVTRSIW